MLFPGRIYIARGLWYSADFCNIFLPNIGEDPEKFLLSERWAWGLSHMVHPAGLLHYNHNNLDEGLR